MSVVEAGGVGGVGHSGGWLTQFRMLAPDTRSAAVYGSRTCSKRTKTKVPCMNRNRSTTRPPVCVRSLGGNVQGFERWPMTTRLWRVLRIRIGASVVSHKGRVFRCEGFSCPARCEGRGGPSCNAAMRSEQRRGVGKDSANIRQLAASRTRIATDTTPPVLGRSAVGDDPFAEGSWLPAASLAPVAYPRTSPRNTPCWGIVLKYPAGAFAAESAIFVRFRRYVSSLRFRGWAP
jgi:hypothetical protein